MQVQYERHAAQAAVAQAAKVQLRKETEWMRRQPKARSTKSKSRQDAFYTLCDTARSGPKQEAKADFGEGAMTRQVSPQAATTVLPFSFVHCCIHCSVSRTCFLIDCFVHASKPQDCVFFQLCDFLFMLMMPRVRCVQLGPSGSTLAKIFRFLSSCEH